MGDFWTQKMRTYFERIDFDKDGAITRADFEGMAERFAATLGADKAGSLKDNLTKVWDQFLAPISGGAGMKKDAFITGMKKLKDDPASKATLEGPLPLFFHAVDADGDGMISEGEFAGFFKLIGLDANMAPGSFQAIDTNNDGLLSMEEFVTAGSEFFLSEDPSKPTKLFWGPLVK